MNREYIAELALKGEFRGLTAELGASPMGIGSCEDPSCRDVLTYYFRTKREIITEIRYTITEKSCLPSKACAEAAAKLALGKPVMEAYTIDSTLVAEDLGGLDREHLHCAMMAELALKRAVLDYARRKQAGAAFQL